MEINGKMIDTTVALDLDDGEDRALYDEAVAAVMAGIAERTAQQNNGGRIALNFVDADEAVGIPLRITSLVNELIALQLVELNTARDAQVLEAAKVLTARQADQTAQTAQTAVEG